MRQRGPGGTNDFYPRSPRGERPVHAGGQSPGRSISIHAPREGSDPAAVQASCGWPNFYPRSPRGERPPARWDRSSTRRHFYPRSPRGERHKSIYHVRHTAGHFYPRSPRGERPLPLQQLPHCLGFLSTLPARGATRCPARRPWTEPFLSTLPARGATRDGPGRLVAERQFLSTLPARGATVRLGASNHRATNFYPRSPRGERPYSDL